MFKGFIFSVPASAILYIGSGLDGDVGFAVVFSVFLLGCPISIICIPIAMVAWAMSMNNVAGAGLVLILSFLSIAVGVHINGNLLVKFFEKKLAERKHQKIQ